METGRIGIFLCLIFILGALPGCGGRKKLQSSAKPHAKLETSVDLPEAITERELTTFGITSSQENVPGTEITQTNVTTTEPESEKKESGPAKTLVELDDLDQEASIEFHFENADLEVLINQISELFDVTFITDDSIAPMLQSGKSVRGNKISFKTNNPLTKREAWDLFLTFLEIAGFTVIAEAQPKLRRIVPITVAYKSPLPAYIGISPELLPSNDEVIRYVYFVENIDLRTIGALLTQLKSPTAPALLLQEMKAFMITDKAYNIKSLMNIIKELDKVTMPQAMSVLKLRRADAEEVEKLYKALAGSTDKDLAQQRFFPGRKSPPSVFFPENVGIFAERRTNSLILLGPADAIQRIEEFITQYVDVDLTQPYSPLHVLPLRYADAGTVANIMNDVTRFGVSTEAGKVGGVRAGDKFLKPMTFHAEPETNRLIVKGDYEDFLKAKEVILELDAPQPQVAIEVLLLAVSLNERKQLGAQIRSRIPGTEGLLGSDTRFQTSGLFGTSGVVENPNGNGVNRLLGNLLNLVSNGVAAGNTIISLGDSLSTWAIIQALQTASNVQVLANPFLIATNKTPAVVSLGEVRRVITGTIVGTQTENTFGDAPANLQVKIKPQINSDGMIVLDIEIELSQFIGAANPENAVRTIRKINTKTVVSNKEVLALGGLIQNNIEDTVTKVPILGDIPILGWLFKNKSKTDSKSNLLVLISTRILEPETDDAAIAFTNEHISDYTDTLNQMYYPSERRDPVNRWFFPRTNLNESATDEILFKRQREAVTKAKLDKDIVTPLAQNNPPTSLKNHAAPTVTKNTVIAGSSGKQKKTLIDSLENEVRA